MTRNTNSDTLPSKIAALRRFICLNRNCYVTLEAHQNVLVFTELVTAQRHVELSGVAAVERADRAALHRPTRSVPKGRC